jgi:hypothetical protein
MPEPQARKKQQKGNAPKAVTGTYAHEQAPVLKRGATAAKRKQAAAETRMRTQIAKADFDAAHAKGMKALDDCDYKSFGEAVRAEREAINAIRTKVKTRKAAKKR